MVDRVWWEWQQKSVANKWAFEGGSVKNKTASPTGVAPMLTVGIFTIFLGKTQSISPA
jgi:hypothetical protein